MHRHSHHRFDLLRDIIALFLGFALLGAGGWYVFTNLPPFEFNMPKWPSKAEMPAITPTQSGKITIKAGEKSFVLPVDDLTSDSVLFVSAEEPVALGVKRATATTFEILLNEPLSTDLSVSWLRVN